MEQDPSRDAATEKNAMACSSDHLHADVSSHVHLHVHLSTLTTIAVFPLYKMVFRQQLQCMILSETMAQLYGEGWRKLFRGVAPPLVAQMLKTTFLFGIQEKLHHHFSLLNAEHLPRPLLQAAAGMGTGVVEALIFTPFERVQNVLQNRTNNNLTLKRILEHLKSKPLAQGFYRALLPIIARNTLGSGLYFGLKNPVRDVLDRKGLSPTASSFASGAINSLVISHLLYPLSVLVANMQADVGQEDARCGLRASARKLWADRQRRVALLYRGGSLVILRSCISWGITTAIYDQRNRAASEY